MDSSESGPPPRKRFMNGSGEGRGPPSESRDSSDLRGGRGGRGFRGRSGFRGRGGFRGGFRGRGGSGFRGQDGGGEEGSSPPFRGRERTNSYRGRGDSSFRGRGDSSFRGRPSFSSPEGESSGFRGGRGRGSFRGRGSSPGFRGRGGSPFRGRGGRGSSFGGRGRGTPFGGGRGSSFGGRREFDDTSPANRHTITIYNLPSSKNYSEQREVVKDLLAEFNPSRVDIVTSKGDEQFSKAVCAVRDEKAVVKACEDLNGRFVEDCQILVVGANRKNPHNKAVVISNLPDLTTLKDLVQVLHDCKNISHLSPINMKASPPYIIVFVSSDDDVKRIMDKSSTDIKGLEIVTKVLDQSLVARTTDEVLHDKWEEILGSDTDYYINKTPEFADIYFESAEDLNHALEKVAKAKEESKESIDLQRRVVHGYFFAEVCDVKGDVNDVELYSLMRKHGEVTEFKRLDKDHYLIKQELSAAMAAMSLSDSKKCGGVLKLTWHNTREPKEAEVTKPDKEKKKKTKKDKKAKAAVEDGNESEEAAVEEDDHMNTSHEDEEMAESNAEEDDEEEEESEESEDDDANVSVKEEPEDTSDEEEEDVGSAHVKNDPEESSEEDSEEEVVTKKKGGVKVSKQAQSLKSDKRNRRPQKRKISSSN